jgi:hypothetical protein
VTVSDRDKRALIALGVAVVVAGIVRVATSSPKAPKTVVSAAVPVEVSWQRLAQLRKLASEAPAKAKILEVANADLARREKGLIQAETAPQAQAQVLEILKRVAKNANPPVDFQQTELGQPAPYGAYGVVPVAVTFNCRIEQLVNMLADITAAPELVATDELRIGAANSKDKTMTVRLAVLGVVPRKLVPARKLGPSL